MSLKPCHSKGIIEAGCDEAGRGCLAGPVCAAAVVLPPGFSHRLLNDSKKMTERQRDLLRPVIEKEALTWAVAMLDNHEIDKLNILQASITCMHRALDQLTIRPEAILVDGNKFRPYRDSPHHCIVKGDAIYRSIAAASVLAKTHRDELMLRLHEQYPRYGWQTNKGYPTAAHRRAIADYGITPHHRSTFQLLPRVSQ